VKVGVVAALAGISYDFGMSTVTRTRIRSLESYGRYFPKEGFGDHHARVPRTRRKEGLQKNGGALDGHPVLRLRPPRKSSLWLNL
jgi:hypothetical protein